MKKRDILHLISILAIAVVMSCAGVDESNHQSTVINVVAGYQENDPDTKTLFADGGAVLWTAGDVIKVLADDVCMTSSECTDDAMSYDFTVNGWPADKEPLYAIVEITVLAMMTVYICGWMMPRKSVVRIVCMPMWQ